VRQADGVAELVGGRAARVRTCPVCGAELRGLRADAVCCGPACRAEASRRRRLAEGRIVDGYPDLTSYIARQRRTKLGDEPSGSRLSPKRLGRFGTGTGLRTCSAGHIERRRVSGPLPASASPRPVSAGHAAHRRRAEAVVKGLSYKLQRRGPAIANLAIGVAIPSLREPATTVPFPGHRRPHAAPRVGRGKRFSAQVLARLEDRRR
jgi:hypothetical protein